MQHDLFGSGHDLDLRSNFKHDLSMPNYMSFNASRQEKHDAGNRSVMFFSESKVITEKTFFAKTAIFGIFAPWRSNR